MTDTGKGGVKPLEGQQEALAASGMAQNLATASGQAAAGPRERVNLAENNEQDVTDTILKPEKAKGAQLQGAIFVTNGSLPHAQVASNTGLVPAAVVTDDPETLKDIAELQQARAHAGLRPLRSFSDEEVGRMSNAEVRAYASDRGYDIGEGGTRLLRQKFLKAQKEDGADEKASSTQKKQDKLLDAVAGSPAVVSAGIATAPQAPASGGTGTPTAATATSVSGTGTSVKA